MHFENAPQKYDLLTQVKLIWKMFSFGTEERVTCVAVGRANHVISLSFG